MIRQPLESLLQRLGAQLASQPAQSIESKAHQSLVTELDRWLETELTAALPPLWPNSQVVGEEYGGQPAEWTWWIDPLDGTTNYIHCMRRSAISVALYHDDQPIVAAVHDPFRQETFWAERDQGCWLGSQKLRVSRVATLEQALLCTGFAPHPPEQWEVCRQLQQMSRGIRVTGCASLDLAYVACGRTDAFWEVDLKAWDVAAGILLVQESGGQVTDLCGNPATLRSENYLACSPTLAPAMLNGLKQLGAETRTEPREVDSP